MRKVGAALTCLLGGGTRGSRILIGRDTRESGDSIEASLARGIQAAGGRHGDAGVVPTAAVAFLTRDGGFDAGAEVTRRGSASFIV